MPSTVGRASAVSSSKRSARPTVTTVSLMRARAPAPGSASKPSPAGRRSPGSPRRRTIARRPGARRPTPPRRPRAGPGPWEASDSGDVDEGHLAGRHRAGLVEDDGVDAPVSSSTSAPLMRMPSRTSAGAHEARPRGQPQGARARDDEHGHGDLERPAGSPVPSHQPAKVSTARTRTTGTNTADTRSASRCTGASSSGPARRGGRCRPASCGADPGGLHGEAVVCDAAAGDVVPGADVDREGLAGHEGRRRRSCRPRPGRRWRPSHRDGPRAVTDGELVDGDAHLGVARVVGRPARRRRPWRPGSAARAGRRGCGPWPGLSQRPRAGRS